MLSIFINIYKNLNIYNKIYNNNKYIYIYIFFNVLFLYYINI